MKTGKVSFTYKQFAFLSPDSVKAAEASECAVEANKFYPYRDKLYENQRTPGAFTVANLKKYASQVGLDGQTFAACLDSGKSAARVRADMDEGRKAGVRASPTVIINGRLVEGLAPLDVYKKIIDEELLK